MCSSPDLNAWTRVQYVLLCIEKRSVDHGPAFRLSNFAAEDISEDRGGGWKA